jgi:hypothetical protein
MESHLRCAARVLERQECRQDDDLEALLVFNIEPNHMKATSMNRGEDIPIEVKIQDLDRRRPNLSRWLFCHHDEYYGWIRVSNDEVFALSFEFMSAMGKE